MYSQQVTFAFALVIFILATTSVMALPIRSANTILSGLTGKPIGIDASSGVEDVKLDLTKRHKHPKDKEHSKGKGHDDNDDNDNSHEGDGNVWLSSHSDESTLPCEDDEGTSLKFTNSEDASIDDLAVAKLAKNPINQLTSHGITTSPQPGKLVGLKADTRHFLNKEGIDGIISHSLSRSGSPALLHGHPSADYYEGAINPNLGADSLSRSVSNLEALLPL